MINAAEQLIVSENQVAVVSNFAALCVFSLCFSLLLETWMIGWIFINTHTLTNTKKIGHLLSVYSDRSAAVCAVPI